MWTPKRVLLLLGGILAFTGVYGVYARLLGWIDGLPPLPAEKLVAKEPGLSPPERTISPTVQRLRDAFGPDCPEQQSAFYPTQLEFRNGESSIVLASGAPPFSHGSNRIVLAPFSVAVFGKPKPDHLRQPGEVTEITTFHSDKAVLEFDRPINGPGDMNKAKLLRMELVSEPEQTIPDRRRGTIEVINNQRSADRNKSLVLRTPGPIFYRDPKNADPKAATGPDIWTDAAVEIVDRQNLPREYGAPAPQTAVSRGADLQPSAAVRDILSGHRLPPPTVTAIGMRVFLEDKDKKPAAPKSSGAGGVQRIELLEKVLIHYWTDARQNLVSSPDAGNPSSAAPEKKPSEPASANSFAQSEPPAATAAVVGGPFFAVQSVRQLDRALLQIETAGRFTYDAEKNFARFDVVPHADPNLPNDVQVHRILPRGGRQELFSQFLVIELNGSQPGAPADKAKPGAGASGFSFKRLHAWTDDADRILTLSAADEDERGNDLSGLLAYGRDFTHEPAANRTILTGSPLHVIRRNPPTVSKTGERKSGGRHTLSAGKNQPATLTMEPSPGATKALATTVRGPGQIELFDPESETGNVRATWQTSFSYSKETINKRELDLLVFAGGASFEDPKADYWLRANELKLWLEPGKNAEASAGKPVGGDSGGVKPQRLEGNRDVTCHSADFDIEQSDRLTVMFRDGVPPAPQMANSPAPAPLPAPANPPPRNDGPPAAPPMIPPPEAPPKKAKPPMKLRARIVDTWVLRYPVPSAASPDAKPADADAKPGGEGRFKYELESARCEGAYTVEGKTAALVHQDPEDPAPDKKGVDIYGQTLLLDHTPDGSVMTVTGADDRRPGQVHRENMSIIGPKVLIDQLHNTVEVEGRGSLVLPSGTDLNGANLRAPAVIIVHWRDRMSFQGATKLAEFFGKVTAQQNEAFVTCHTLQVQFDRPIDFSPRKQGARPAPFLAASSPDAPTGNPEKNDPKVEYVRCYPAPGDLKDEPKSSEVVTYSEVHRDETGRIVKSQQVVAREMEIAARAFLPGGKDPYKKVEAVGPGTVRIWQIGQKDVAGPPGGKPAAPAPKAGNTPKPEEAEMKLTVVQFVQRMVARDFTPPDKSSVYQDATFYSTVRVIHAPADRPELAIDPHRLPPGAVTLNCDDRLVVSSHKKGAAAPVQRMDAYGNAYIRSDEYDGWGETVTSDGPTVTLKGGDNTMAKIYHRFNSTHNTGKVIVYNRLTGAFGVDGSAGSTFQGAPAPPKPTPKK